MLRIRQLPPSTQTSTPLGWGVLNPITPNTTPATPRPTFPGFCGHAHRDLNDQKHRPQDGDFVTSPPSYDTVSLPLRNSDPAGASRLPPGRWQRSGTAHASSTATFTPRHQPQLWATSLGPDERVPVGPGAGAKSVTQPLRDLQIHFLNQ
ncbi:unnamed protein product [Gadus morhua 'NCC']